ncbi:hypothetical protein [Streptomyces sp. ODS28]|uniref:hypothetical protein n=1 Tax=Streptomyces sp. ODS28 TaxID=3136688 RepID=UPI0031E897D3
MTELPQTRTRTRAVHWAATAVALAAVVGGAALVQPPDATARTTAAAAPDGPPPDPERATYPVDCGKGPSTGTSGPGVNVRITDRGSADFDGDGRTETVAVVRCDTGMGTPPSGVFVLAPAKEPGAAPRITETLVPTGEQMSVKDFAVHGRTVSATLLGYSSEQVPRCCPDRERKVKWVWQAGKFTLVPAAVAGGATAV